jgi:hypothetical protein
MVAHVGVALVAAVVLVRVLMSAVRTFVIPRDEPTALTRAVFQLVRVPFFAVARRRDRVRGFHLMRAYAPSALLVLPIVWIFTTWLCFGAFYWVLDEGDLRRALEISGSAVTSLGEHTPVTFGGAILAFGEAALGLGLVALLITYLPTIYAAYQRREAQVSLLGVRADTPPSAVGMLRRFQLINAIDDTTELWADWELWFVDVEESHTSMGSLAFFQSGLPNHSWVTASGAVLDAASLLLAAVDVKFEPRAALCVRSGFLALRRIADFFDIPYDPDPAPDDPISITRAEFDAALASLESVGVPLKTDREQAWRDFSGWRVNYDTTLLALCGLVWAPDAAWSGDRAATVSRPPLSRRGGRGQNTRAAHQRSN